MEARAAGRCADRSKMISTDGLCEKPTVPFRVLNAITTMTVRLVRGFSNTEVRMPALYGRSVQITSSGSALRRIGRLLQPMPRPTIRVPRPVTSNRPRP